VLDRVVDLTTVRAALRIEPAIDGELVPGASDREFVFRTFGDLPANTKYSIWFEGLTDADGVPFVVSPELKVQTVKAPAVVRFRPQSGTSGVARGATVSVRFSERMDRRATNGAFAVTVDGKKVAGKISWAEQDTVLVFDPAAALPYGAKLVVSIADTASSKAGVTIAEATSGRFSVAAKPVPPKPVPPRVVAKPVKKTTQIPHSGGGGAVSGSWTAVETYYLKLMNCTRTGGWVTSSGDCSSPGGRDVAALSLNSSISSRVSRPYAKLLATRGICSHYADGDLASRLHQGGISYRTAGENLGCRSGNPYSAVLGSHLFFQSERPYNGGHYRNMMNSLFREAGVGIWVSAGRVRLTVDFIQP
jgi:uncharacterized protein YkwD